MDIKYDLDKIKYSIDEGTWERAVKLYDSEKVTNVQETWDGYKATVNGSEPYKVFVSAKKFDIADCDCYLGKNDQLCKHMVALAIWTNKKGQQLTKEEAEQHNEIIFSNVSGELDEAQIVSIKNKITEAMKLIKAYNGPSKIWFQYQASLIEGCNRLSAIFSNMPAGATSTEIIISTLLKLDKKLSYGGIDDSDGTVGEFICQAVVLLEEFAKVNQKCISVFKKLASGETCFGWEEPLVKLFNENQK